MHILCLSVDPVQLYLVMVVSCIAAATAIAAAADSSTGSRQSAGPFHRAARLLKG